MGYPVWLTPAGDLGKIAELEFYSLLLEAIDPEAPLGVTKTAAELGRTVGVSSRWSFNGGLIEFEGTGLPYHSYDNASADIVPAAQNYKRIWTFRGGVDEPTNTTTVAPGEIGIWLNGVAIYSPESNGDYTKWPEYYPAPPRGFSYNASYQAAQDLGLNYFYDIAGGRASRTASGGAYHYSDFSFAQAWSTGVGHATPSPTATGLAETSVIPYYDGDLTFVDGHSKILGFSYDGYPVYGPWGYNTATDVVSGVRRLASSYRLRDPAYRSNTTASDLGQWPMGIFVEDYEYVPGLGDLDQHNGRWGRTPDYPYGTYAYFCTVDSSDDPVYPYVIGKTFYAEPAQFAAPGQDEIEPSWPRNGVRPQTALTASANVEFQLLAGRLPPGMQLSKFGTLEGQPAEDINLLGVPAPVNQDKDFSFAVRAKTIGNNPKWITDRAFKLTVSGNKPPSIITGLGGIPPVSLGTVYDGSEINIQIEAQDLDFDPLSWSIIEGALPPGVTLTATGQLTGIPEPFVNLPNDATTGWDKARWEKYPWQFSTRSETIDYAFTVQVSDGKTSDVRRFSVTVLSTDSITADNETIDVTIPEVTVDTSNRRYPVILTKTLGDFATYTSDNYFSYKFDAVDWDGDKILFSILLDGSTQSLPPGLTINPLTGWLTGYIPIQIASSVTYDFTVKCYKEGSPEFFDTQDFTITILGSKSLDITWLTDSDLGTVRAGDVSRLKIEASSATGKSLRYSFKNGSRLPQGLVLLTDGLISGRASFQSWSLDRGTTSFDKELLNTNFVFGATSFDSTFTFTVIVSTADGSSSAERTFTLLLNRDPIIPYENLYMRCLPDLAARNKFVNIIENSDIFTTSDLFRPNDQYWGKNRTIDLLAAYGVNVSTADEYINAMQERHYNKTLYFGNYGVAVAKDNDDNILYEVIYVELIEDTRAYKNGVRQGPPAAEIDFRSRVAGWENPTRNNVSTVYPNDSQLLRKDISDNVGSSNILALPQWMRSVQNDGTVLNFITCAPLAYVNPGMGEKVLFRLNRAAATGDISNITDIPFRVDRYVLDSTLSINYDPINDKFIDSRYTTFDLDPVFADPPVATVDVAVDIPFNYINGKTAQEIQGIGGLDGIVTAYNGLTLVFATQELYDTMLYPQANEPDSGWRYPDSTIVASVAVGQDGSTLYNPRQAVWQISVGVDNIITLTELQEIQIGDIVKVNNGARYGGNQLYLDPTTVGSPYTSAYYTIVENPLIIKESDITTFDLNSTRFRNNVDIYEQPDTGDKYIKFTKIGVFS
jgi:hypothetical protein